MPLISSLKVIDLKELLRKRNLPTNGTKVDLIERLTEAASSDEIECDEYRLEESMREQINIVQRQTNQCTQPSPQVHNWLDYQPVASSPREYSLRGGYSIKEIAETLPEYDAIKDTTFSVNQFVDRFEWSIGAYSWDEKCY